MVHHRKDSFKLTLQLSVDRPITYGGARFECFMFLLALYVCSISRRKSVGFYAFLCGLLFPECLSNGSFWFSFKKKKV
jgi:hypothetical protein